MQEHPHRAEVTQLLVDWGEGSAQALDDLIPLVYDELHRQARRSMWRERRDHTLQPTALVHETFLQLVDQNRVLWQNRAQFFGIAAQLMRRIVLKHARRHNTEKRGGHAIKIPLDDTVVAVQRRAADLLALDEALERLQALDARQARIVELRYYGGLTIEEAAEVVGVSTATIKREARLARAWLQREMTKSVAGEAEPVGG